MTWSTEERAGWGRMLRGTMETARPLGRDRMVSAALEAHPGGVLAAGNARSYGDVGINPGGRVVLTEGLNRMLAFDAATGVLEAEPGVTVGRVAETFLPRGWMLPVVPGTSYVTLGGAVANDVHGKNHEHAGGFGHHVEWIDLVLASGELRRVAAGEPLFEATVGGLGLTGVMVRIAVRLKPCASAAMMVREERADGLDDMIARMQARRGATYTVAWLDGRADGARLGQGILESAEVAGAEVRMAVPPQRSLRVPVDAPSWLLNPLAMDAFNQAYLRKVPAGGRQHVVPARKFYFPLDALSDWNRLYGRRGFFQFQCVVPEPEPMAALLRTARAAFPPYLVVLKTLGPEGSGMLSFPQPGWTLAMDFPNTDATRALARRLEAMVLDAGGRLYLAKDSLCSPEALAVMYPRLGDYRAMLRAVDPEGHWSSGLRRRLEI